MRARVQGLVGDRRVNAPFEAAAWIIGLLLLTLVLTTNQVLADSSFFFVAHDTSGRALVLLWILVVGSLLLALTAGLALVKRLGSARTFDVVATGATLAAGVFLLGNAFGWALGVLAGLLFAVLARRVLFGPPLLAIASVTSVIPLVFVPIGSQNAYAARAVEYQDGGDRPDVLWIMADAAQSQVFFTPDGEVRPLFPNLRRLQATSTTYARGYATANHTPVSVASMLNGVAKVPLDREEIETLERSSGIVSWLAPAYDVTVDSAVFSDLCTSEQCSQSRSGAGSKLGELGVLVADVAAVAGNTLHPALASSFPPLEGRWRNFWQTQSAYGGREASGVQEWLGELGSLQRPQFALWHSLETHDPYDRDFDGERVFDERELAADGAWFDLNGSYPSSGAERLARRLYLAGAMAFDRQLGAAMDRLQADGELDNMMLIVSSDHGVAFSRRAHIRVGENPAMRWNEVAHVPLMVKLPGQTEPQVQSDPRSTAQIARTILDAAGVVVDDGPELAPGLQAPLDEGPFFLADMGLDEPILEELPADLPVVDGWTPRDLGSPFEEFPFASTDPDILPGEAVSGDWTRFSPSRIVPTRRDSPLQLLALESDAARCPADESRAIVVVDGEVVAQVVWEQTSRARPEKPRGWAVVPRARLGEYSLWCQPVQR